MRRLIDRIDPVDVLAVISLAMICGCAIVCSYIIANAVQMAMAALVAVQ